MDEADGAAALGIVAAAALVVLAAVPYTVADPGAVGVYYAVGPVGPPVVALLAVVAAIAFLAGVRRRSDPAVAAGAVVVLGAFAAILSLSWALGVTPSLVGGLTTVSEFRYHRWAVVLVAAVLPVAGGLYARAVV